MVVTRKECNLRFVVGRHGEFGESYYIRSFWFGIPSVGLIYDLYADSDWVVGNPSLR